MGRTVYTATLTHAMQRHHATAVLEPDRCHQCRRFACRPKCRSFCYPVSAQCDGCVSETTSDERVKVPLPVPGRTPERNRRRPAEVRELRRRNKQWEQENEILRRATAYFAHDTLPK